MKKQMITGLMAVALICMMTGCGKEDAGNDGSDMETEGQIEIMEETVESESTESPEEESGTSAEETEGLNGETETSAEETAGVEGETKTSADAPEGTEKPDTAAAEVGAGIEGMELSDSGNVTEITDTYITVSLAWKKETDNGTIMVGGTGDIEAEKKVYYTDKTIFKILEVRNAGVNPEKDVTEKDASINDLKKEDSIQVIGSWDSEGCQADMIYIYHFM